MEAIRLRTQNSHRSVVCLPNSAVAFWPVGPRGGRPTNKGAVTTVLACYVGQVGPHAVFARSGISLDRSAVGRLSPLCVTREKAET